VNPEDSYKNHRREKNNNAVLWKVILPVALLVVGLAGGFAAGANYQKKHMATTTPSLSTNGGFQGGGPDGGARMAFSGTMGSVTAISSSSISVQDQREGTTKTYAITSSTTITNNGASATYSDIAVGDTVLVRSSSTTSTDATAITLNPSFGGGPSSSSGATTYTN
jgi:hypothetical protein